MHSNNYCVFVIRQWKYEKELQSLLWKIEFHEIIVRHGDGHDLGSLKNIGSQVSSMFVRNFIFFNFFSSNERSLKNFQGSTTSLQMRSSRLALQEYQSKTDEEERNAAKNEKVVERKISKIENDYKANPNPDLEFFDSIGPLCLGLHKRKLIAMKRIYKTNVTLTRSVLKELKQVS